LAGSIFGELKKATRLGGCLLIRKPASNTSGNQQHYHHSSERNGGQIHNVVIGFAPSRWVLSHLNSQFNGKWPAKAWKNIAPV
jgi:hypothetical protein